MSMSGREQTIIDALCPLGTKGMTKETLRKHFEGTISSRDVDHELTQMWNKKRLILYVNGRYAPVVDNPHREKWTKEKTLVELRTKGLQGTTAADLHASIPKIQTPALLFPEFSMYLEVMREEGAIFREGTRYFPAVDPRKTESTRKRILQMLRATGQKDATLNDIIKHFGDLLPSAVESVVDAMVEETSIFLRPDGRYVAGVDPDTVRGGAYYDDPADSFPVHFQTADTRPEVMRSLSAISDVPTSFNVEAKGELSTAVQNASMPLTVTVSDKPTSPNVLVGDCQPWSEVLQKTRAELCLKVECASVTADQLLPLVVLNANTLRLTVNVWSDETLRLVASLVKQQMCVKDFTLRLASSDVSLSDGAFCELLDSLCSIPDSSRLQRFVIPTTLRKVVLGDPLSLAESVVQLKANAKASSTVEWDVGGVAPGSPAAPSSQDENEVKLWLACDSRREFDPIRSVSFPRDRLLQASPVVRGMLEDSPEESRVPLPMDSLQVRSVSLDALRVTAALVRATASTVDDDDDDGDDDDDDGDDDDGDAELPSKRKRKEAESKEFREKNDSPPAWTMEFQAVFELDVLPLVAGSGELPYRRQQLLKLFGEVLEIGRFLELRAAYEFGLVGGTGVVGRAISCE